MTRLENAYSNLLKQRKADIENNIQHHQQIHIHLNNIQSQLIHNRFIVEQYEAAQQYYQFISNHYNGFGRIEPVSIPPLPQASNNFTNSNARSNDNNDFSSNYSNGNLNQNKNKNMNNSNINNNNNTTNNSQRSNEHVTNDSQLQKSKNSNVSIIKNYKCFACNIAFKDYQGRSNHIIQVHGHKTGNVECKDEECDASFPSVDLMENHYKYTHLKRKEIESKCPKCKKEYLHVSTNKKRVNCKSKKCGFNQKYKGDDFEYTYKSKK